LANNSLGPKLLQGEGTIEGVWMDYNIHGDDLFGLDFKYNRFDETLDSEVKEFNRMDRDQTDGESSGNTMNAASYWDWTSMP